MTAGADNDCSLVGYDEQIRRYGRAFERHFGPRGQEFERSNLQKFKCPGLTRGRGGGGGMLKFQVDRRITIVPRENKNNAYAKFRPLWYF